MSDWSISGLILLFVSSEGAWDKPAASGLQSECLSVGRVSLSVNLYRY